MKNYDLITIGTGSAMGIVDAMLRQNPNLKVALIDKDEPGGICLTKGCIPSKLLLYPAELIRTTEKGEELGIDIDIKNVDFAKIMDRMREIIYTDIDSIRKSLSSSKNVDYYPTIAEFISPYILRVGEETLRSNMIILCTGSAPMIPPIKGLEDVGYHTSDSILKISQLPKSIAIIGGGFIAAEYGHFFSAMGSKVTIIGRNPQFLPGEEPEVSMLAKRDLEKYVTIITNHEVREATKDTKEKKLVAVNKKNGRKKEIIVDEILVATGRRSNSDILHPEKAGIKTDEKGWIEVNEYLETSQPNVWALGDANGKFLFKHVANYESMVVYFNAALKRREKVDYHAIPYAVFTYPEIASVGLKEKDAIEKYGTNNVLIGIQRYQDTAKGEAMAVKNYFVKIIVEKRTMRILGAHIIGPYASILIQEIINLMYTPNQSADPVTNGMHIHPALNEVVERAFRNLMPPDQYHHLLEHSYKLEITSIESREETQTCPQCGREISLGATFCDSCGSKM
jgi:dihydrolipoamide dehydrogenase